MFRKLEGVVVKKSTAYAYLSIISLLSCVAILSSPSGYLVAKEGPVIKYKVQPSSQEVSQGMYGVTTVSYEKASKARVILESIKGRKVVPESTPNFNASKAEMENSKSVAYAVVDNILHGTNPQIALEITDVKAGSQAALLEIKQYDRIDMINGKPVNSGSIKEINEKKPLKLLIKDLKGYTREVEVTNTRPLGILIREQVLTGNPITEINTGKVGGSSGGLVLALYILDLRTPGDLTSGLKIAGSGSLNSDGTVGRVNRVDLKYSAALKEGFDIFFTSQKELNGKKVVHVETVLQALKELCQRGSKIACTYTKM
ncbi:MAG: hypothetical protein ACKOW9_04580 [Candidatus Paceibacterota bacterium]